MVVDRGDRVMVLLPGRPDSEFQGWATVNRWESYETVRVVFDHIPPNNIYGYPPEWVFPLFVIEEEPCLT